MRRVDKNYFRFATPPRRLRCSDVKFVVSLFYWFVSYVFCIIFHVLPTLREYRRTPYCYLELSCWCLRTSNILPLPTTKYQVLTIHEH